MTIKTFTVDPTLGHGMINDIYGGVQLQVMANPDIHNLLLWWREWRPVFESKNPSVVDALNQARALHGISQE